MPTLTFCIQRLCALIQNLGGVVACLLFASPAQSLDSVPPQKNSRIFLLGEIHDNPNGHSARLAFVRQLVAQQQKPVVAMEQFDRETQPELDLALARCQDVDCVLKKVGSPDWDWDFYKPYVQMALDHKITLVAANLSNADLRQVMNKGFAAVYSPQVIAEYKLNSLPMQLLSLQRKAIQEGHCNLLPAQAIDPMVQGQIARDVWMASVVMGGQNPTVILIAGNGHVRKDAGVYPWLSPQHQAQTQVHAYTEQAEETDTDAFDQVHRVATIDREDPCLVFHKMPVTK